MAVFCGRLAYDGTDYHGFQFQLGAPTIQGALEEALDRFARPQSRVAGAGRTDTGVHAAGQVIAVEVDWQHGPGTLQEAWNAHLPFDIHLRQMIEAPAGFHPRFDACARTYRYSVVAYGGAWGAGSETRNRAAKEGDEVLPRRSPLTDRYSLFEPGLLDLAAMNRAAALLVGEHDFVAFGWPTQGESTVRRILQAEWREQPTVEPLDSYPGRRYVLTIRANGFLRRMVRLIAGFLLDVGRGRRTVESVTQALAAKDRQMTGPPAPSQGLVLERVDYPARFTLW